MQAGIDRQCAAGISKGRVLSLVGASVGYLHSLLFFPRSSASPSSSRCRLDVCVPRLSELQNLFQSCYLRDTDGRDLETKLLHGASRHCR